MTPSIPPPARPDLGARCASHDTPSTLRFPDGRVLEPVRYRIARHGRLRPAGQPRPRRDDGDGHG